VYWLVIKHFIACYLFLMDCFHYGETLSHLTLHIMKWRECKVSEVNGFISISWVKIISQFFYSSLLYMMYIELSWYCIKYWKSKILKTLLVFNCSYLCLKLLIWLSTIKIVTSWRCLLSKGIWSHNVDSIN
jgi:hypothetical protein